MANLKGPKGFIAVTPTGTIEILQDSYLSWITMFYLMSRVLVEKWPEALKIPRKPFEALRKAKLIPESTGRGEVSGKKKTGITVVVLFVFLTCVLFALSLQGII